MYDHKNKMKWRICTTILTIFDGTSDVLTSLSLHAYSDDWRSYHILVYPCGNVWVYGHIESSIPPCACLFLCICNNMEFLTWQTFRLSMCYSRYKKEYHRFEADGKHEPCHPLLFFFFTLLLCIPKLRFRLSSLLSQTSLISVFCLCRLSLSFFVCIISMYLCSSLSIVSSYLIKSSHVERTNRLCSHSLFRLLQFFFFFYFYFLLS